MLLSKLFQKKPFKYLSTAKDYEGCISGRYVTEEDRIVKLLNQLQKNLNSLDDTTKKEAEENQRLLEQLYSHCKGMSDHIKLLEEKLYDQNYQ
jgi:hypothetical protein